jgi:drug/metabolite transporter (DMT)-like permease
VFFKDLVTEQEIGLSSLTNVRREDLLSWPALLAVIFWGFSFIATKVALREVHPFTLLTLRFGIGGLLLLLAQLQKDRQFLSAFTIKDWVSIVFLAVVGISGHTLLQAYGLLYTSAINTGWIVAIMPIFITIAARLFLGEAMTARKMIGILIGFLGVFLVISKGVFSVSIFRFGSPFGDFLILMSALTWTGFTVGGRGFLSRFSSLAAITPIMIVGCLIALPFTWLKWEWDIVFHLSLAAWMGILFLGVFCSGLAYLFWYSALEKRDSSNVGMYLYLEPLATLIGAYILLSEEIRWITLMGGGMILLGVYLATKKFSTPSLRSLSATDMPSRNRERGSR